MSTSHNPVQRAFQSALRDFKAGLKNEELYDKITSIHSIDEVYDYTDKLQEEQSRTGSLRHLSRLEPYLTRLSQYVAVLNNFGLTQMTPSVTSVLCGPILLLLQWASVLKQSLDAVVEITARIGELLPEFTEVAKLFHDNTCLQEVLVLFFRDILDFYSAALSFFGQSRLRPGSTGKINTGFRAIFEALWPRHRSKIEQVATHIERHTSLMRNEVRLADIREEHDARIRAWEHFERTEMDHQRQEYKGIKTDINPPSYEKRFAHFRLRICKGTGDWLLNDKVFMQWFDTGDTTVKTLWLTGIPGAGKSFLATTIVDAALTRKTSTAGFAFLDYKQSSALSALSVIHSLIFQMASRSDDMEAIVCQSDVAAVKSQVEIATALLKTVLDCAGPSHIVIDGLDEIDGIERIVLIKQLLHLSAECSELKVVFSSRGEADIARVLRDNKVTIIEAHRRKTESIEVFVDVRRDDWFRERQFSPEMQEELTRLLHPLAAKAGGMFLYVRIVFDTVWYLDAVEDIQEELRCLPETLGEAYERVLSRINNFTPRTKDMTRKVLGWIGCTPTPLTTQELTQVLAITPGDVRHRSGQRAMFSFGSLCGPIVEVIDDYVQFVHFTVHEYIFSPAIEGYISFPVACSSLAACAVTYLCREHHDPELDDEDVQHYVLSGAYTLHNFAANFMHPLITQCLNQKDQGGMSEEILRCLSRLCDTRRSLDFQAEEQEDTFATRETTAMKHLRSEWLDVVDLILDLKSFHDQSSRALYSLGSVTRWIHLDPLTVSLSAAAVHSAFDYLLCGTSQHAKDCTCHRVTRHYGSRLHFCPILACTHRRNGFSSKVERDRHLRDHDKPWKCDVPGCEYADKPFLSRRMRDDHIERSHKDTVPSDDFVSMNTVTDFEQFKSLLVDLVKADQVTQVQSCLSNYQGQEALPLQELRWTAARFSSRAMMEVLFPHSDLLSSEHQDFSYVDLCFAALDGGNLDTSKYLAPFLIRRTPENMMTGYVALQREIFGRASEVLCKIWVDALTTSFAHIRGKHRYAYLLGRGMFGELAIGWTAGQPAKEQYLLSVWERLIEDPKLKTRQILGNALIHAAGLTSSVKLARWLLDRGVEPDFRISNHFTTALYSAAKKDSYQAALLLRFLLSRGADPTIRHEHQNRGFKRGQLADPIEEARGPKNISKWLGIPWAELVAQTALARRTKGNTGADDQHILVSEVGTPFSLDQEDSQSGDQV